MISDLVKRKDGKELLRLSVEEENHEASLAFAKLVFTGGYSGERINNEEQTLTKKEMDRHAKDTSRADAQTCIVRGAEVGDLGCIEEAADMYLFGRSLPGVFGALVIKCTYKKAVMFYQMLLEHDYASAELVGLAHFRMGVLIKALDKNDNGKDWDQIIHHWELARNFSGEGADLATAQLARYYYYEKKDYARAIPLLVSIQSKSPYSALLLGLAYKHGNGVKEDQFKYNELLANWNKNA